MFYYFILFYKFITYWFTKGRFEGIIYPSCIQVVPIDIISEMFTLEFDINFVNKQALM